MRVASQILHGCLTECSQYSGSLLGIRSGEQPAQFDQARYHSLARNIGRVETLFAPVIFTVLASDR